MRKRGAWRLLPESSPGEPLPQAVGARRPAASPALPRSPQRGRRGREGRRGEPPQEARSASKRACTRAAKPRAARRRKAAKGRLAARGGGSRPRSRAAGGPRGSGDPGKETKARTQAARATAGSPQTAEARAEVAARALPTTERDSAHTGGSFEAAAGGPRGGRGQQPRPRSGNGRARRSGRSTQAQRSGREPDAKCAKRPGGCQRQSAGKQTARPRASAHYLFKSGAQPTEAEAST